MSKFSSVSLFLTIALLTTTCAPYEDVLELDKADEWVNFSRSDGLGGNRVNALTIDSDNGIWMGHENNGVTLYKDGKFKNYDTSDGLIGNTVTSIVELSDGVMLFGTYSGLSILEDGDWFFLSSIGGFPLEIIDMELDADGVVWMATTIFGLIRTEDFNSFTQLLDPNCGACNTVNTIYLDSRDQLWFGTYGGLKLYKNNSMERFTTSDGLPDNIITSLFEDSRGSLWVGTFGSDKVGRRSGLQFEEVSLYNGATQNWSFTINEDRQGNVWISSIGNGLIFYDGVVMRTHEESISSPLISTLSSVRDQNGDLWFGTFEGGVWKYTPQ